MTALVVFPDTNLLAHRYALQGLAEHGVTGIAVATELPSPMQNRFIRCFTIPGRATRRTQTVQVIGQVYDVKGKEPRCAELARLLGAVLRSAPDMVVDGQQWVSEP